MLEVKVLIPLHLKSSVVNTVIREKLEHLISLEVDTPRGVSSRHYVLRVDCEPNL